MFGDRWHILAAPSLELYYLKDFSDESRYSIGILNGVCESSCGCNPLQQQKCMIASLRWAHAAPG
jgi:hypothetical protein